MLLTFCQLQSLHHESGLLEYPTHSDHLRCPTFDLTHSSWNAEHLLGTRAGGLLHCSVPADTYDAMSITTKHNHPSTHTNISMHCHRKRIYQYIMHQAHESPSVNMLELDLFSPFLWGSASWGYVVILQTMHPHQASNLCIKHHMHDSQQKTIGGRTSWISPSFTSCHLMHTISTSVLLKADLLSIKPPAKQSVTSDGSHIITTNLPICIVPHVVRKSWSQAWASHVSSFM